MTQQLSKFSIGVAFFLSLCLVSFVSHYLTIKAYENTQNEELYFLNKEFINKTNEIDTVIQKIKDIEEIIGFEYDENTQEDELDISNRIDKIKQQVNIIVAKNKMKESFPHLSPLKDTFITDHYGVRFHPLLKKKRFHKGVDLRADINTKVFATAKGVVRQVGNHKNGYGKFIIIQHNFGFETVYAHLNRIDVRNGDTVEEGDMIGLTGNTGRSTGPHLHYETRFGGQAIRPIL